MGIVLEVDDVDAWYERIKALIPIEGKPQTQHWNGRNFFVHDPGGVPIEIYMPFKKQKHSGIGFGSASRSIADIKRGKIDITAGESVL